MPKAKKRKTNPATENGGPSKKKKRRTRPKKKQDAPPAPAPEVEDIDESDSLISSILKAEQAHMSNFSQAEQDHLSHMTEFLAQVQPQKKRRHDRPPEIQELRGNPDPIATVTAANFRLMGRDLQSNLQGVFQDINHAFGKTDAAFEAASQQLPRRTTRAAAGKSDQFFKSLIPKDKVPEIDGHIRVEFEGTNIIKTDAPGYTETITFGNGRWERTRNGVSETGDLDATEAARIVTQMRQMGDGLIQNAARSLEGILTPENWDDGSPPRGRAPIGIRAPRGSVVGFSKDRRGSLVEGYGNEGLAQVDRGFDDAAKEFEGVNDMFDSLAELGPNGAEGETDPPRKKRVRPKASDIF